MKQQIDGMRPHFDILGERGFSEQGVYRIDLPGAGNADAISESEESLEYSEQSSDDNISEDGSC